MSVAGVADLHERNSNAEMPKFTTEISGSSLQFYDTSPTATPAQTRSGSPMRGTPIPHTADQTIKFMDDLRLIAASKNTSKKSAMAPVGEIDGSVNVSTATKMKYLMVYFLLNLALTLYNKAVMIQVSSDLRIAGNG